MATPNHAFAHPVAGIADCTPMFWTRARRDRTRGLLEADPPSTMAAAAVWNDTCAFVMSTSGRGSAEPAAHESLLYKQLSGSGQARWNVCGHNNRGHAEQHLGSC